MQLYGGTYYCMQRLVARHVARTPSAAANPARTPFKLRKASRGPGSWLAPLRRDGQAPGGDQPGHHVADLGGGDLGLIVIRPRHTASSTAAQEVRPSSSAASMQYGHPRIICAYLCRGLWMWRKECVRAFAYHHAVEGLRNPLAAFVGQQGGSGLALRDAILCRSSSTARGPRPSCRSFCRCDCGVHSALTQSTTDSSSVNRPSSVGRACSWPWPRWPGAIALRRRSREQRGRVTPRVRDSLLSRVAASGVDCEILVRHGDK